MKMIQRLEVAHVSFLKKVTRKQAMRRMGISWRQVKSEAVLQGAETQTLMTYMDRRQATVAEFMAIRPIFDVCERYMGYKGGGYSGCHGGDRRQSKTS